MPPLPLERRPGLQPGVSVLVRYFMVPCNACLILLATSTLGFAVLLFLSNCTWPLGVAVWVWPRGPAFASQALLLSSQGLQGRPMVARSEAMTWLTQDGPSPGPPRTPSKGSASPCCAETTSCNAGSSACTQHGVVQGQGPRLDSSGEAAGGCFLLAAPREVRGQDHATGGAERPGPLSLSSEASATLMRVRAGHLSFPSWTLGKERGRVEQKGKMKRLCRLSDLEVSLFQTNLGHTSRQPL